VARFVAIPQADLTVPNGIAQANSRPRPAGSNLGRRCLSSGRRDGGRLRAQARRGSPVTRAQGLSAGISVEDAEGGRLCGRLDGRLGVPTPRILLADDSKVASRPQLRGHEQTRGRGPSRARGQPGQEEVYPRTRRWDGSCASFHQIGWRRSATSVRMDCGPRNQPTMPT